MEYSPRSITSLTELKPGDHIVVDTSTANADDKASSKEGPHHYLVVEAMDYKHAKVIHNVANMQCGVKEERQRILPRHVTVLDYESKYSGEEAIKRARKMLSENINGYVVQVWRNSESFVSEAHTGEKKSSPVVANLGLGGAVVTAGFALPFVAATAAVGVPVGVAAGRRASLGIMGGIGGVVGATMGALAREGTYYTYSYRYRKTARSD